MNRNKFTSQLYFELAKKGKHPFDIYGDIFSKIFYDVKEYERWPSTIKINQAYGDKYNTLGEVFGKSHQHGIFNTWPNEIITNLDFNIVLYDDGFEVCDIEFHNTKIPSLMKPEYQKRYVSEMYKMFGEPYKKHYQEIIQEKRNKLEEEAEFVK